MAGMGDPSGEEHKGPESTALLILTGGKRGNTRLGWQRNSGAGLRETDCTAYGLLRLPAAPDGAEPAALAEN